MKKIFAKSLLISFSLWYAVFSTVLPFAVSAQTPDPTPTPTPTETVTPTPSPTPTDTPTDTPTPTDTASSSPTPSDTTSPSPTPTESPTPTPDPAITTGDATASADGVGVSNISQTQVQGDCGGCATPTPSESPSPSATPSLDVNTTQSATSEVTASSAATTGNNSVLSDAQVTILTGLALALANSINMANVNLVGSNLLSVIQTILGNQSGDVNLYSLFEALAQASPASLPANTTVVTDQTANLQTTSTANADSGQNSATGSAVQVTTGDAGALANSINVANLNFVGSNAVFTILNILGSLNGDIILPNGTHLALPSGGGGSTTVLTNQTANVQSSSTADANTGNNSLQGSSGVITTGNAGSLANAQSFVNLVQIGNSWGFLIINNFGSWLGNLINWETPGSSVSVGQGTHTFESSGAGSGGCIGCGNLTVVTNQNATVNSSTTASSNTGGNSVTGAGSITTGNAFSYANDFTLANVVGVGGGFFFGIVNILGSWIGNLEVAYPDLAVSISDGLTQNTPGSPENYSIVVTNQGKANAANVNVNFSADSNFVPPATPEPTNWHLDNLGPGQSQTFTISGFLLPTALINSNLAATASVSTGDTESDTTNNQASDSTLVVMPEPGPKDTRTPDLGVTIWNNVNDFVYPGDTVLAAITVANQSPFVAHDVKVQGHLFNDHPMPAIPMSWDIGDLKPGEKVKISFSIGLIKELPGGEYHLSAEAVGQSESGDAASSGIIVSNFLVMLKEIAGALAPEVSANQEGSVLGASTENLTGSFDVRKYLPYILVISGLALLIIPGLRRKLQGEPFLPLIWKRKKQRKHSPFDKSL